MLFIAVLGGALVATPLAASDRQHTWTKKEVCPNVFLTSIIEKIRK
jgi:hypothetical protein